MPAANTRVTVAVDVVTTNANCPTTNCAQPPDPARGPLDPKFALYEPGVTPALGPFNGFFSAECGATPDTGCAPKPANACFICDNAACTEPSLPGQVCGTLSVNLPQRGTWIVAVAPQAPAFISPQSEGCYVLTITAEQGGFVGPLTLIGDDVTVTFAPPR